jgi:hypothetical protein
MIPGYQAVQLGAAILAWGRDRGGRHSTVVLGKLVRALRAKKQVKSGPSWGVWLNCAPATSSCRITKSCDLQ